VNSNRRAASVYEDRYRIVTGERAEHWPLCVYCGNPAGTRDHVPPISRVGDYESLGMQIEVYVKVPACTECNMIAADTLQPSFMDRAEYVKDRLARKYARSLSAPDWDEDELAQLGRNLRSKVRAALNRKRPQLERIEYYAGVEIVLDQIAGMWEGV
jgi:hypothetical protein